jgi:bifunctional non-homologous end joining protein LigD
MRDRDEIEPFPASLLPMLATAASELPPDPAGDWAYELKWDGVRALAYLHDGGLRLESRNLNDITPRYPELHGLAGALPGHDLVLDGEVVAFDPEGRPSFGLLQTRMHVVGERNVAARVGAAPLAYLIFDVLHIDGRSTRDLPWTDRRRLLEELELAGSGWQTPQAHVGAGVGPAVLEASKAGKLEGVVAKRTSSLYVPGRRSRDWLKVKNTCRQEVVVGGWLPGAGNRTGRIGALLAGYHDDTGALRFAGKVGTGFTDAELVRLGTLFAPRARDTSPFADKVPYREARYLEPELVAEIEFTEWTHNGTLRHPSYKGLRDDKPAAAVVRET